MAAQFRAYCLHGRARHDRGEETNRRALEAIRQLDNVALADSKSARVLEARALLLWAQARRVSAEHCAELLRETERACAEAESLVPRASACGLAVVHALLGEPEECRRWFEVSREPGRGVTWDEMATDPDLESVRGYEWSRTLLGEEASQPNIKPRPRPKNREFVRVIQRGRQPIVLLGTLSGRKANPKGATEGPGLSESPAVPSQSIIRRGRVRILGISRSRS